MANTYNIFSNDVQLSSPCQSSSRLTWVTQHNSESWRPISVGKWDTFDLLRNCSSNVITLFRGVDNLHKIDNERIRWDTEIGWMMADLKCGLAVRIISGIFGFLDPGRGRHQMEDSSGDNQAEGADTASARTRNQALCSAIILIHIHTLRPTLLGQCPQLWRWMYPSCENILLTRNYFHWGTTVTVSLCFLITTASVRIVTTRGEGKLMCGCGMRPGVENVWFVVWLDECELSGFLLVASHQDIVMAAE